MFHLFPQGSDGALRASVSLDFNEAVDALKLRCQALDAKRYKFRQIEGQRLPPTLMQKRVIFQVMLVEVAGQRVQPVSIVSALKQHCSCD